MKWSFPSNNNTDIIGIGHSGIETFQGTPLKSLAREICQNSIDAALNGDTVLIEFKPFVLSADHVPDSESLLDAFNASFDFWKLQASKKTTDFFDRAISMIQSEQIPFLRISDFNTTGLVGSDGEYNTPWCNLTKSQGSSDKTSTSGGSFGIGKFAPFACSELRTVFYSTLDTNSLSAFQGISRITSFKRKEDNEITLGIGYYGGPNNSPVHKQLTLDPNFIRSKNQTGTDVFIAGFRYYSSDWKTDIIASILDGFLYAIFTKRLTVHVDDIIIDSDSLPDLISEYKTSLSENADNYYTVLTSPDTVWYEANYKNHGCIKLGLIILEEMHRKVAMIRKTGMKIMDRGHISGIIPFAGVMLIEGEKINDFLRNIENPQHTKWEPERIEPKNRVPDARAYVKGLIDYIKECLEKLKQEDDREEIDAPVGEYLPDESNFDQTTDRQEYEALPDTIKSIEITLPKRTQNSHLTTEEGHDDKIDDETGDLSAETNGSGSGHMNGTGSGGRNGQGDLDGEGDGSNPVERPASINRIAISKARLVCLNKAMGEYSMNFVPQSSSASGRLDLFLSAESQNYTAPIKKATIVGEPALFVNGNQIQGLNFTKDKPVRIKITLDYDDYCSIGEVKAYGY